MPFLTESLRRLRWCACDSASTRQFAPVSSLSAVRESCFVKTLFLKTLFLILEQSCRKKIVEGDFSCFLVWRPPAMSCPPGWSSSASQCYTSPPVEGTWLECAALCTSHSWARVARGARGRGRGSGHCCSRRCGLDRSLCSERQHLRLCLPFFGRWAARGSVPRPLPLRLPVACAAVGVCVLLRRPVFARASTTRQRCRRSKQQSGLRFTGSSVPTSTASHSWRSFPRSPSSWPSS